MDTKTLRQKILEISVCGCAGGFVVSSLGTYTGAFPGMDVTGAVTASIIGWLTSIRGA